VQRTHKYSACFQVTRGGSCTRRGWFLGMAGASRHRWTQRHFVGLSRVCALVLGLFALTIQSFAVQTHVHGLGPDAGDLSQGAALPIASITPDQAPAAGGDPGDNHSPSSDQIGCPICQSYVAAGLAILPITISLRDPGRLFLPIAANPSAHLLASTHIWRSRGPPLRP